MDKINYEEDRVQSVTQADAAKSLSDKVIELKNLEDEIQNAEESISKLKNFTQEDYLLLTGDPAIIGVACSVVSNMTNGKYNLLKWDRQEKMYYPIKINLYEKGEIDE